MEFLIGKEHNGTSVLDFLRREIGISAAMLCHLKYIPDGITADGSHVTVRHILREGELLCIKAEDSEASPNIVPSDIMLDVSYEDSELVVPNKPPYMPTHPSHGHFDDTVANALCHRYRNDSTPFVFRPINRLDRNTSGLLLIARNRMAAARLTESLRGGMIEKEYVAILDGVLPSESGEIEGYIKRAEKSIIVRCVCGADEGGDFALTRYRVIFSNGKNTVVAATPVTGRTHQLRVHFSHVGAPIVGDDMYGHESEHIGRHALHSSRLSFPCPKSAERISVSADLPSDMTRLLGVLFSEEEQKEIFSRLS